MKRGRRSFDPRRHRGETQVRLIILGLSLLGVVGGGLVWGFYGRGAALSTFACLLAAAGVIGLLWLILSVLERWVKEGEP